MNYARKCKYKNRNDDTYETLHGVNDLYSHTFCGKEINEMWFIENERLLLPLDITCKICKRKI